MSRPNVLIITSDQQLWDTLGFKNPHISTPALDRLAREGTDFTRAYTINPVCTPTRATLATGLYPSWHGAWTIGVKLPEDVPTLGAEFLRHDYESILIGKAHFQPLAGGRGQGQESIERQPTLRDLDFWRRFNDTHTPWYGFNHVETCRNHTDEAHCGGHYAIWMEEHGLPNWRDYFQAWPPRKDARGGYTECGRNTVWELPEEYHYSVWTAERTIAAMERCVAADKPFYLWSSFHDPHPSYLVPEPWASMYDPADMPIGRYHPGELDHMPPPHQWTKQRDADWSIFREPGGHGCHGYHYHDYNEDNLRRAMAVYYGMTSLMDREIGRILDALDRLGLADNTLVVFTTDHGHYIGHHGLTAKGAFHYEEGIRLPYLVRWPGQVPAGHSCAALQSLIDLPPTFLSACGLPVPGYMQGVDQLPCWRGEVETVRDHCLVEMRHQPTTVHLRTYLDRRYKLTLYRDRPDWGELFDLQEDPGELRNRFHDPAYAGVKAELMAAWLNAEIAREPTRFPRVAGA